MVDIFQQKTEALEGDANKLREGQLIKKRYLIQSIIGEGASATVYQAIDTQLGSLAVALKVFTPHFIRSPQFQSFYAHELQSGFKIDHENVVRLYDMIRTKKMVAIVNELVDGITLDALYNNWNGKLKPAIVKEIILQIARGLEAIHAQGIIHHDLKPQNILVASNGFVKISDFGVCKYSETDNNNINKQQDPLKKADIVDRLNQQQKLTGTPYYAAPEYLTGSAPNFQHDLYAVGIMMHELLHGKALFDSTTLATFVETKLEKTIPKLNEIFPDCPKELATIADRLVTKNKKEKFNNTRDFRMALEKLNLPNPGITLKPPKKVKIKKKGWLDQTSEGMEQWSKNFCKGIKDLLIGIPALLITSSFKAIKAFLSSSFVLYPLAAVIIYLLLSYTGIAGKLASWLPR